VHPSEYLPRSAFDVAAWRKATASKPDQSCVELATVGGVIGIRDSKVPDGPILQFSRAEIRALFAGVRAGEFDHLT